MREKREITHIFVAKKTNKQTKKEKKKLICIQCLRYLFCSFSILVFNFF